MFRAVRNSLSSIIYPQECRVCSGEVADTGDGVACCACWGATRFFTGAEILCRKCGGFLGDRGPRIDVSCHRCDGYHFTRASALGVYEGALAASILNLKVVPHLPRRLADTIASSNAVHKFGDTDVLIPVPLSRQRLHERGFNQADIIARAVSRSTGIAVDERSLARTANTPMHRMGMDQKAREITIDKAFEVSRPKLIAGRNVLLVDDVLTSGATASQAAKTLMKSGAARVDVFTLARAVFR